MYFGKASNRNTKDANGFAPSSFSALIYDFADIAGAMSVLFMCIIIAIIMLCPPVAIIPLSIIIPAIIMRTRCALPSKK